MLKRSRNGLFGVLVILVSVMLVGCSSNDEGDNPIAQADVTAPEAPIGVEARASVASDKADHRYVDVSWAANAETDLAGYNLYWTATPDDQNSYEYLGYVPNGTESYQDEKAEAYWYVHYKVTAIDESQNESDYSEDARAQVARTGGGSKYGHYTENPIDEPGD